MALLEYQLRTCKRKVGERCTDFGFACSRRVQGFLLRGRVNQQEVRADSGALPKGQGSAKIVEIVSTYFVFSEQGKVHLNM